MKKNVTFIFTFATIIALSCNTPEEKKQIVNAYNRTANIHSPDSAIQLLKDGNLRFIKDSALTDNLSADKRKTLKEKGQNPFAVIVTCSDSRVSPELVFDQGLGDLFVIRVAGNVVDSVGLGSIEYAVEHLHTPLVIVMGHEKCGAVKAAVEGGKIPGYIVSIVKRILPSVRKAAGRKVTGDELFEASADENIKANVAVVESSHSIKEMIETGKVKVIGGKYLLGSGEVRFE